jgi:hypothetical protein
MLENIKTSPNLEAFCSPTPTGFAKGVSDDLAVLHARRSSGEQNKNHLERLFAFRRVGLAWSATCGRISPEDFVINYE